MYTCSRNEISTSTSLCQLGWNTTHITLNNHLGKIPITYHINTLLKFIIYTLIPWLARHSTDHNINLRSHTLNPHLSFHSSTTTTTTPPIVIPLTRGMGRSECRQPYPCKYHYSQRGIIPFFYYCSKFLRFLHPNNLSCLQLHANLK